jgi:hypothetical protein
MEDEYRPDTGRSEGRGHGERDNYRRRSPGKHNYISHILIQLYT